MFFWQDKIRVVYCILILIPYKYINVDPLFIKVYSMVQYQSKNNIIFLKFYKIIKKQKRHQSAFLLMLNRYDLIRIGKLNLKLKCS